MRKLLILSTCALFINVTPVRGQKAPFIFGGQQVTDNTYTFMVYVSYEIIENAFLTCSASLIDEKWVLTSAHCFEASPRPEKARLVAGQPKIPIDFDEQHGDLQIRNASKIIIHENYDYDDDAAFDNDIALVKVDMPFQFNENVSSIKYFREKAAWEATAHKCTIVGFGYTEQGTDGTLYHALKNPVLPPEICQQAQPKLRLNGHFVCIFHNISGICQGDSGGPLLCDGKIYGLSTMEWSKWKNCTVAEESYFLLVVFYLDWIAEKMEIQYSHTSGLLIGLIVIVVLLILSGLLLVLYCTNCTNCKKKNLDHADSEYALVG